MGMMVDHWDEDLATYLLGVLGQNSEVDQMTENYLDPCILDLKMDLDHCMTTDQDAVVARKLVLDSTTDGDHYSVLEIEVVHNLALHVALGLTLEVALDLDRCMTIDCDPVELLKIVKKKKAEVETMMTQVIGCSCQEYGNHCLVEATEVADQMLGLRVLCFEEILG